MSERNVILSVGCDTHPDRRIEGRGSSVNAAISALTIAMWRDRWAGAVAVDDRPVILMCPECSKELDSAPGRDGP